VPSTYTIEIAPTAYESLKRIKDKKALREMAKIIDGLARGPARQGKALVQPLEGLRSLRAGRSRYRIIYRVHTAEKTVAVLLIGERKAGHEEDVYALAEKLLKTFLRKKDD
jgi:addiction module RelE/StbE family toxin